MRLEDSCFTHRNPQATADLVIPIRLVPTVEHSAVLENFRENSKKNVQWLNECPAHDGVALICGSAPSINQEYQKIRSMQEKGASVFACNSSAFLLKENGIGVTYQAILDPLEHMESHFFHDAGAHLLASMVSPKLFELARNPILWHPLVDWIADELKDENRDFMYIGRGVSVSISAICIAYTMGYRDIHIFGMDSCFEGEKFYANGDGMFEGSLPVTVEENGKVYNTTYDMKQQVLVFFAMEKALIEAGCKVIVHGYGLLPETWAHRRAGLSATQLLEENK